MDTFHDLIVFGATGFTGRLAAVKLGAISGLKLAIAGRSHEKLEAVAKQCTFPPSLIIADSSNSKSIYEMVKSGRVIANFAGPFALHGEPVIAACAELGRSYCDITGETPFIRDMIDRYEAKAQASGACLIPMAGFDSIPGDLLSYIALREGSREGWHLNQLTHYYQIKGGFNGGTLESALTMAEQKKSRLLYDANILIPDKTWKRNARSKLKPTFEPILNRWSAPFIMNFINAAVVRRSLYLKDPKNSEVGRIDYQERLLLAAGPSGKTQAYGVSATMGAMGLLTENKLGRALLRKIGPSPGEGPSEKSRREGFYKGTLVAREGDRARLVVKMKAQGDPGNEFTTLAACETALLLVAGKARTRGFTTGSRAFGEELIKSLEAKGVTFNTDILETRS